MKDPVAASIEYMWQHLDEQITLDNMASAALFSRFYFSRVFHGVTGTSPGRFLTAVRMAQSKIILATTDYSVSEVAASVGYDSLGTFTTKFSKSVGISPAVFRKYSRNPDCWEQDGFRQARPSGPAGTGRLVGTLELAQALPPESLANCRTYVVAFKSATTEGLPYACEIIDGLAGWRMLDLPDGEWFIRAITVATGTADHIPPRRAPLLVGGITRVRISGGASVPVTVPMHEPAITDLPILILIPELDCFNKPANRRSLGTGYRTGAASFRSAGQRAYSPAI
ncbi:MAG: AraC family transcriptional regulator [Pseudonocardiales bacterium]|jgi:AraC-like DNA-binding protein|nr:AraC family transcriptional regulator [Pseudonocardiales bacterium]